MDQGSRAGLPSGWADPDSNTNVQNQVFPDLFGSSAVRWCEISILFPMMTRPRQDTDLLHFSGKKN